MKPGRRFSSSVSRFDSARPLQLNGSLPEGNFCSFDVTSKTVSYKWYAKHRVKTDWPKWMRYLFMRLNVCLLPRMTKQDAFDIAYFLRNADKRLKMPWNNFFYIWNTWNILPSLLFNYLSKTVCCDGYQPESPQIICFVLFCFFVFLWGEGALVSRGFNFSLPVPFNPGSRPIFVGSRLFALFRLRNVTQWCVISPWFSRFPLPLLPPPVLLPPTLLPGFRSRVPLHTIMKCLASSLCLKH